MSSVRIERTGPRTTVQDLGRPGYAHLGVPAAGAVDATSLRRANRLVGNPGNAACLETTMGGLVVTAVGNIVLACTGSLLSVDGAAAVGALAVADGCSARVATPETGVYSYLAVAGGFAVFPVLGSASTDTLAGIGPRIVRAGDELAVGSLAVNAGDDSSRTDAVGEPHDGPLRVVLGPREDWFSADALRVLLSTHWSVRPDSDRVGLRLAGPQLDRVRSDELPSEGVVAGAIQVPPDGTPILFLANHPTTGGYPVIAVVVRDDVERAAQRRPGRTLHFVQHEP